MAAVWQWARVAGAFGVDADAISHEVIRKGSSGYQQLVEFFGKDILSEDGEIDRERLGRIVFTNDNLLKGLEDIIHPLVSQEVDHLIERTSKPVIVIEAIKLLEGKLGKDCQSIWVAHAPRAVQIERLTKLRNMNLVDAHQRIDAQPPQEWKLQRADVVIENDGTLEKTWEQVREAWKRMFPNGE